MDINYLMKQAKAMQNQLAKIEKELAETSYTATAGGENIKVTLKGNMEVTSVEINEELLEKENKEMLQDLVTVALNAALKAALNDKAEKTGKITQGVKMPGMF